MRRPLKAHPDIVCVKVFIDLKSILHASCLAGAQIRADAAEKKLQESTAQMLAANTLAAGLEEQLKEHQSTQSYAVTAQQDYREAQQHLQLLQRSHQDLSDRFQESSTRCSQLQVQLRPL